MNINDRYDSLIKYYAELNGLYWIHIKAQIRQESAFNPNAMNQRSKAKGLSQFMDATWKEWGNNEDVFNPESNIKAQCKYMKWLMNQFDNDISLSLAAYNWGIGNVKRLLKRASENIFTDFIPKETQGYLANILKFQKEYEAQNG